jgi:monofunctional chorismate mutase
MVTLNLSIMDKRILEQRKAIDEIDGKIISLLKKRMDVSKKVGELKTELQIPIEDKSRENDIIERLSELAEGNLSEEQLIHIFTAVFGSSKQIQK